MKRGNREAVRATLFEVIENQLQSNDPPETRETLNRLLGEGHTRKEGMKLIACALVIEINEIVKTHAPYNHARYVANLKRLPDLPDDDDVATEI